MFNVRNVWSAVGGALALIAIYLVLENGTNASRVIGAFGNFGVNITEALQGR